MANYIINSLYGYNQIIIANIFCFGLFVVSIISWTTEYDSIIGNKSVHDQNNSIIQKAALEKIAAKLKADPIIGQRSLYFPIISPYVNENSFFFILLSSGYYSIKSTSSWRLTSLSDHEKRLREADYAIIFSDNSIEPMSWISSIKIRKQIREMVQSSSNFELIEVADLSGEGRLFLYKNRVIQ